MKILGFCSKNINRKPKIFTDKAKHFYFSPVGSDNAPLLLGQSALEQFGSIEIDNKNDIIILK